MSEVEYITVKEALTAVLTTISVLPAEQVPLLDGLGRVLAQSVVAQDNLPPFANSAMDGYALVVADLAETSQQNPASLRVIGDVAAGGMPTVEVTPGTAVRIMTGAPLPFGANAVVPVEDTDEAWRSKERPLPTQIQVYRTVQAGDYIRHAGEDIEAGETILEPGHILRPQEVGVLASLGVAQVSVIRRPRVAILATGDELLELDQPLQPGKIRNSNEYTQAAQIMALGAEPVRLGIAGDTETAVRNKLQAGLDANVDLFISSAGVSVGAYDVVKAVLEQEGKVGFWRVRMRPGKPLAYGTYHGIPYLGLPGNPVSAMVSFERFARAAILKMTGHKRLDRPTVTVTVQDEIHSDGRESYIRAIVSRNEEGYVATLTGDQGSHIMTSLVKANALLIVPEGVRYLPSKSQLAAWMIDWPETIF
ncbi:MAG: molybdopterin molybdotransferase MoeA [Chloroflexi bacterium]|nr:molybdopterin molybdotransferase MoeA [Chloroflexota bacterium]